MEAHCKLWTVGDAADAFDRSTRTVRNYIIDGKIQVQDRTGRHGVPYQIPDAEVKRFLHTALAPGVREKRGRKKKQAK